MLYQKDDDDGSDGNDVKTKDVYNIRLDTLLRQ